MEKINLNSEEKALLTGLYFSVVYITVQLILKEVFLMASPFSPSIAMLVSTFTAYPIFIRGSENRLEKGKKWTFFKWLIFGVIPFSVLAFIFSLLVDWLIK